MTAAPTKLDPSKAQDAYHHAIAAIVGWGMWSDFDGAPSPNGHAFGTVKARLDSLRSAVKLAREIGIKVAPGMPKVAAEINAYAGWLAATIVLACEAENVCAETAGKLSGNYCAEDGTKLNFGRCSQCAFRKMAKARADAADEENAAIHAEHKAAGVYDAPKAPESAPMAKLADACAAPDAWQTKRPGASYGPFIPETPEQAEYRKRGFADGLQWLELDMLRHVQNMPDLPVWAWDACVTELTRRGHGPRNPKPCRYCGRTLGMAYPGNDPENGPAGYYCPAYECREKADAAHWASLSPEEKAEIEAEEAAIERMNRS